MQELRMEVNKKCNYSCVHCYTDKVLPESLPLDYFTKALNEAHELGATSVSLTGGEPLLAMDKVKAIANDATSLNMKVRVNTNGDLLNEKRCLELIEAGVTEFQISLNGYSSETFDPFTQVTGSFERVIRAIEVAVKHAPVVTIRFTLMDYTAPFMVKTFNLVESLGVHHFKVRTLVQSGDISETIDDNLLAKMKSAAKQLFEIAKGSSVKVAFSDNGLGLHIPDEENIQPLECLCGHSSLFMTSEGHITPCTFVRDYEDARIGHIEKDSLVNVFNEVNKDNNFEFKKSEVKNGCVSCAASAYVLKQKVSL